MYRKEKFRWVFILTLGLMAIVGGIGISARASVLGVSEQEEIDAGQQMKQQVYKEYGQPLSANDPMSKRVTAIGMRFANLSSRKNIPYSYQVLKNDKVLNAFAAPGGPVFVTTKLVETASNDAELAFVLGHETAHIDRKHIVKAVEKQQKVAIGVGLLGAIFGYNDSNVFQVFSNVAFTVWSKGYSRDQESEADSYGIRWMSQLGFDPKASISMFQKLGGDENGIGKYLSDHPQNSSRVKAAEEEINKDKLEDVARKAGGPSLNARNLPAFKGLSKDFSNDIYSNKSVVSANGQAYEPVIAVQNGDYKVVLAAVRPFAEWAGAKIRIDGNETIVSLDRKSISLKVNSERAKINGKNTQLSTPARLYQGNLYAPIGNLADGVGGTVAWDSARHGVDVRVGDKSTFWAVQDW